MDINLNLFRFLRTNRGTDTFTRTQPLFYYNQLLSSTKDNYVTIDDNEFELYRTTPELQIVVNRDAQMLSSGIFKHRKQDGTIIENSPYVKLLENPNSIQTRNEWLIEYQIQKNIYGNQFIYVNKSKLVDLPKTLNNLPAYGMKIIDSGKYYKQLKKEDVIKSYELTYKGSIDNFEPNEIIHTKIVNPNDSLLGLSPLHGLTMPISNLRGAYGFRNRIILKNGALGILSSASKDQSGGVPLSSTERERIEKQYLSDYGTGDNQNTIMMTGSPLTWQPMTNPTKDLLLFEEVDADFKRIIDAYGHNENIYSTSQASKYDNLAGAWKMVYQDRIFAEAETLCFNLSKYFKLIEKGEYIELDYSHLPVLKDDEKAKAETLKIKADAISTLLANGYNLNEIQSLITL
jgi:phage portal protein BeeE